nr:hypothetical protein [Tanacetum cinerariifolium]
MRKCFSNDVDHHISSPPANTTHDLVIKTQHKSFQAKAKMLMKKAKHNMRKITFKKAVEQKFKECDHKLGALTSTNVPEAIEEVVQAKVMRFLALGWHLKEIHMTWAHLEEKQTYTKSLKESCSQNVEKAPQA